MSKPPRWDRDPVKRSAKRARQRAAGYRGVKKTSPPAVMEHNKGKSSGGDCGKERALYGGDGA